MSERLAYSLDEAAAQVGLSKDTLRRAIRREDGQRLKAKKHGTKYLIPATELADWLDRLDDS